MSRKVAAKTGGGGSGEEATKIKVPANTFFRTFVRPRARSGTPRYSRHELLKKVDMNFL